jgi:hypothetical protein
MWTDLTGGFDTRFLNLVLSRAGVNFITITVGDDRDQDVRLAAEVCRRAGWSWTQVTLPNEWPGLLPTVLPLSLYWSDGRLEILQLAEVLWGHALKSRSHLMLLLGGGHEHFRGHVWQQEFLQAGRSSRVNFDNLLDMRWMARPVDTSIFVRDPTAEVRAELLRRAQAWVEPYSSELNTTQLDILHAYRMMGHFGSFGSAGGCFLQVEVPAYFKPVYTAAISTNYRHRTNHQLMRHMIRRLHRLNLRHAEMLSRHLYDARALDDLLTRARDPGFRHGTLVARIVTLELVLRSTAPDGHIETPAPAALDDVLQALPG